MHRLGLFPLLGFLCLLFVQCQPAKRESAALSVFVSILPQKYFVDKIGGKRVSVTVMVEPGASPHSYEPKPSQMAALSKARAYFAIGLEFENVWLPKFCRLNKGMAIIPMDSGIMRKQLDISAEDPTESTAGSFGHDHHEGADPHIWLSPELVKKQVRTVREALCRLDPDFASSYTANCRAFEGEITALQDSIRIILKRNHSDSPAQNTFMVFHPSWAYFGREFNLRQIAIEIEGKEPSARQLQTIIETAKQNAVRTIFVQPQFSQRSAQIIASELKIRVAIADDLAYDWANNLIAFAKAISLQ
jgi:zinc transport system substrate-binding protein